MTFVPPDRRSRPPEPYPPQTFRWRGRTREWGEHVPSPNPAISVSVETHDKIEVIARRRRVSKRKALELVLADVLEAAP